MGYDHAYREAEKEQQDSHNPGASPYLRECAGKIFYIIEKQKKQGEKKENYKWKNTVEVEIPHSDYTIC
jgi:hypothetical protein